MPPQQQQQQQRDEKPGLLRTAIQSVGIFLLIQFATKTLFGAGSKPAQANVPAAKGAIPDYSARPHQLQADAQYNPIPQAIAPMWPNGVKLDLSLYISPSVIMPSLKSMPASSKLIEEKEFQYGNFSDKRVIDTSFEVPREVQNNGTLFGHFYIAQSGYPLDPTVQTYDQSKAYYFVRPLTQYLPKKKKSKTRSLLSGKNESEVEEVDEEPKGPQFASFFHPNFTFSFVPDSGVSSYPQMHPAMRSFVQLERTGARDASGQNSWYYPILFINTFWQLKDHMTELNSTVKTLPFHVDLNNLANWKFSLMASIDEGMKQTARNSANGNVPATGDGSEFEEFKRILLDSNIYLLATTGVVSLLHTVFEMLAFKSDVGHWRNKKDNVGVSFRTILANVIMQSIIFLYLMDNNENTSWMILFGQGMGIAVEAWKITKTVDVRIRQNPPGSLLPYSVRFEDKHKLSETEKKTQEYDQIAFKYLYVVAVPLLLAYAGYSLVYDTHKSWYSFIITTLVGSVYAYGFLMMVPSLYINYRLKSVAHMPAKAMMYKFLNTFIDDLFAFTIKMPTLHRLATLRDDVIFFVYLYQSWKYKVDYTRVNEFGQGGDDEEEEKQNDDGSGKKELPAPEVPVSAATAATSSPAKELAVASGKDKGQGRKRK